MYNTRNNTRIYYYIHLVHGCLVFLLLFTGAILYLPGLRTFFRDYRWEIRHFHAFLGIVYFFFILLVLPYLVKYMKNHVRWQKTFHICLHLAFGIGWTSTGIFLWANHPSYLGLRQFAITIHDFLSLFIIPWVIGHVFLWVLKKKRKGYAVFSNPNARMFQSNNSWQNHPERDSRDRGIVITRRDVLMLFAGGLVALVLGGLARWFQPVSESFLAGLETVKRRGYFRIYSVKSENPEFDPNRWRLTVDGLVENSKQFSFDELMQLPKHQYVRDFHCVTGWSVTGVKWEGIPFHEIMKLVGPKPEGKYVTMYSADQIYRESYELSQLLGKDVILAYKIDEKPLIPSQGAPLRLFHPDMYGYKSIKWVNRITFTDSRVLGYWEEKEGYDLNGYIS